MSHGTIQATLASPDAPHAALSRRPSRAWGPLVAGAICVGLLALGWRAREAYLLAPDAGLGYALGPIGLGMMVILLGYSVRKRVGFLRRAGSIRRWFHTHMVLGLAGPTAILLHANFQLGSLNSRVALVSMLAVAGSGLIGRFIYTRIHYEYFGRKAELAELRRDAADGRTALGTLLTRSPDLVRAIEAHERQALAASGSLLDSLRRAVRARFGAARVRRVARRCIRREGGGRGERRELARELRIYLRATRRTADYGACERAFALWHAVHLPLCVILFAAAAVHIVAVHRY